jgi:arylsulfatase A-like enzyme
MPSYKLAPIFRALTILPFLILSIIASGQKPNIIYILTDDLGYGDVSAYNPKSKIATPWIDALAKEGMLFTDAHANSSVCTPTRYGILTGRYAWRTNLKNGVLWSYDKPLITPDQLTVAQLLKNNGYQTACIGKWHLGLDWVKQKNGEIDFTKPINGGPTQIGFDYFYGISASLDIPPYVYIDGNKITATRIDSIQEQGGQGFWRAGPVGNDFKHQDVLDTFVNKSIQYISKASKQKDPFFLYLALASPHTPILPASNYKSTTATNAYGDFVSMTDAKIGEILQYLKDNNLDKNTMIVFTSDNGCSPSANFNELREKGHDPSAGFRGTKADIYEGGHRIPFIVKWPGNVKANSINNTTICLTDFMSTCSALLNTNLQNNAAQDSYSLLPLLTPSKKTTYQRRSTVHHSIDGYFAIRKGDWKLAMCRGSGGWSAPTENQAAKNNMPAVQLYNLKEDPSEQNNVYAKYPEMVRALTEELEKIKGIKK